MIVAEYIAINYLRMASGMFSEFRETFDCYIEAFNQKA